MNNAKLYVIGDSFSVMPVPGNTADADVYVKLVAQQLSQSDHALEVHNNSLMGASQDWIWTHLQTWLAHVIEPQDYLIIALTHPSRMWFLDRLPGLTNMSIIDLDDHVTKEEASAIMLHVKHIQRPQLDLMNVNNRFGYLCYQISRRGLRRPLVLRCFTQDLDQAESWQEFMLAKGVLMDDVQQWEFEDTQLDADAGFWYGLDCRYNHLCLSNHKVLADKIVTAFATDTAPDLTQGFHRGLLKSHSLSDLEFVHSELDTYTWQHNQKFRAEYAPKIPWAKRVGITTFAKHK